MLVFRSIPTHHTPRLTGISKEANLGFWDVVFVSPFVGSLLFSEDTGIIATVEEFGKRIDRACAAYAAMNKEKTLTFGPYTLNPKPKALDPKPYTPWVPNHAAYDDPETLHQSARPAVLCREDVSD